MKSEKVQETVEQAPVTAQDVLNSYRAVLGRDPESEAVIQENLNRSIEDSVGAFLRSGEFHDLLAGLAHGHLPPHAHLTSEAVREACEWAEMRLAVPDLQAGPQGTGCSPVAALVFGVLRLELAAPALAQLPAAERHAVEQMIEAPERSPLSLLTGPPQPEDAAFLQRLLYGEALPRTGELPPSLLALLQEEIHSFRFGQQVAAPLLSDELPALPQADAGAAASCRDWLGRRLGIAAVGWQDGASLLASFLDLPFIRTMLVHLGPGAAESLSPALARLRSGETLLRGLPATAEDVAAAWQLLLGRTPDGEAVMRPHLGRPLLDLLGTLLRSDEFRHQVLHPLVEGRDPAAQRLTLAQRRALDGWLAARLARPATPEAPLSAAALWERLLSWPVLAELLQQDHGALWRDAEAAVPGWRQRSARGLVGGIDYVTGEIIAGWALDQNDPDAALEIEIRCDGAPVGLGLASRPRLQPSGDQTPDCGFRIAWNAAARPHSAGRRQFRIHHARTGEPIGPTFQLDTVFVEARDTLRFLAGELERTRQALRRIENMLPQVESFATFPAEDWEGFRRRHRVAAPAFPQGGDTRFGLLVDAENVSPRALRQVLASLAEQSHAQFHALCLASSPAQCAVVRQAAGRDGRFSLAPLPAGRSLPEAAAALFGLEAPERPHRAAECLLLLPAGIALEAQALAWMAHAAARYPTCTGFYADGETIAPDGLWADRHLRAEFRSAYDRHLMRQHNLCGEVVCARRPALVKALQALPGTGAAAQAWLVWARLAAQGPLCHLPRVLSATIEGERPPQAEPAPPPGLEELLAPSATALPEEARIAVIIPTRNGGTTLRNCLASLALHASRRERLEIIVVDNGSDAPETLGILADAERIGLARRLRIEAPFNWSQLNNRAAAASDSEVLLFLNDDTRMLTTGWDDILLELLSDAGTGAVGARLVYEDFTIQHAGVLFGLERLVGHEGVGAPMDTPGPGGRWTRQRAAGAVTGAFLACRRADFERAGGFDEQRFGVTFNDVDFCLRLRTLGLEVVYAPQLALVHFESKTRGIDHFDRQKQERAESEARALKERWGAALAVDPGWNPHWSRWSKPFAALREPSAWEVEAYLAAAARGEPWKPLPNEEAESLLAAQAP